MTTLLTSISSFIQGPIIKIRGFLKIGLPPNHHPFTAGFSMIFHRPAARATYPHNRSPQIQPSRSTVSGGWHDPREQWCLAAGLLRTHRAPLAAFQDDDLYAKSVGEEFSGNL